MNVTEYLTSWSASYKDDLVNNIMPFWLKNGLDRKHGGVYTCVDRDGTLMDTTKSVWFQGRFGFISAYAYNHIEKNPEWLEASKSCIDFLETHCFDKDGHMFFEVTEDGRPLRKRRYVFSEGFAAIALAEYAAATGEKIYAERALEIFKRTQYFLNTPGLLEPKYLPALEARGHSITMILINTAARIREVISDPVLDRQIDESIATLRKYFIHPEFKALLEMVGPQGELIDTCNGRVINPGHCIETAWFIMEEAHYRNNDNELMQLALQILDWSWEWGWDKEFGGIINFRDCRNFPPQDYSQDMKFWWPQTEAIIATLYAYKMTCDEKYLEMHKQISEWTYAHFPDKEYGEWYGYLHRDGSVAQPAKGNIFKGPFHIPRMMIRSHLLCEEILKSR
ncbi:Cellobiose 2-epimerase [Bacteroides pyogenes]|uniref:AGE family epimerase/isomerase n=1 Tax=Bacteroides pyogenes TaxID=310300 RepID=UPI001BAB4704|nr:AGE family epimerase/isomerase [Bacteroides pyogenes]MBR8720169.1 Cellobiose 2-epimerase [Bacteroides pyogenes]MBR8724624.1 Cellobiose 2-epimerase [Bacteroides pyogenes]MBR8738030.1 Cellobiose 2-epimerase [Bacteroides pyogenes]MBR8753818.1 Cellobiose 2-epimerase [Bacteroides pyogenes]MBR8787007.1 Cellobiose 2-epimerase [Bacteroides pyogenes]